MDNLRPGVTYSRKVVLAAVLGLSTGLSVAAHAGGLEFVPVNAPVNGPTGPTGVGTDSLAGASLHSSAQSLTTSGTASSLDSLVPARDFGDHVPFRLAAQQIMPQGMLVHFDNPTDGDKLVSWHGGSSVKSVLAALAREQGLSVRYEGQLVRLGQAHGANGLMTARSHIGSISYGSVGQPKMARPPAPPEQESAGPVSQPDAAHPARGGGPSIGDGGLKGARRKTAVASGADTSPRMAMEPPVESYTDHQAEPFVRPQDLPSKVFAPKDGANGIWYAPAGQTLSSILGLWGSRSGWMVAYKTDMVYTLEAPVSVKGDVIQAVTALINSLHVTPKPRVVFYRGNHVMNVSIEDGTD